jgi:glucose-6-phosphate 1-dehydrogenase
MTSTATQSFDLVLFGGTGDLALRKLLPALYFRFRDAADPSGWRIIACARQKLSREDYLAKVGDACREFIPAADFDEQVWTNFTKQVEYVPADAADPASFADLARKLEKSAERVRVFYLSTAANLFAGICERLSEAKLVTPQSRVVLEKPLGRDLASSNAINDDVGRIFGERQIFRIDHYLGKEAVQNLLALRFGNALFEPLWNARHIEQVQITVAETVGAEGRGDYYDESGATRDMLQNHLLQLLCLTAMEPPSQFEPTAVRNEKIKVLRSLRPITRSDIATEAVAGQYTAGAIDGHAVAGYAQDLGRASRTESFVALRACIDNWRWSGVPFYLRTGKRMPRRCTEIYLQFRAVPHSIFAAAGARVEPNALVISLQPQERIELRLMSKTPGLDRAGLGLSQVALDLDLQAQFSGHRRRHAYERLYLDALEGNGTLFVRRDETEAAWHWVDALLAGWAEAGTTPRPYPAGTWGPGAAVTLTERHGHSWRE